MRREFSRNQQEAIVERSKRNGVICCEGCGLVLAGKPHEIDHVIPEGLRPEADKKKPLTIAEGQLLGKDCCHRGEDGKTNKDVAQIAKAKRQNAKHLALKTAKPKAPIQSRPKAEKAQTKPSLPVRPMFAPVSLWQPLGGDHD